LGSVIVVDSSAWIDLMRGRDTETTRILREPQRQADILVGDLILFEVLRGARDDVHAARIKRELDVFPCVPLVGSQLAAEAARNYRILRAKGVTLRGAIDLLIATFCLVGSHDLLASDRDYPLLARHLGLRLIGT
jgi:predicted nucleic acid-binding protein